MRWSLRIVALGLLVAGLWFLARLLWAGEQTRIKRRIAAMERAVEQGNLLRLEGGIAADYSDDWGLDKSRLLAAAHSYRQHYESLFIHISDLKVEVEGDRQNARAVLIAKVAAKPRGSGQETELFADRFRLYFRKGEQGWRLTRIESPELKFD